MLNRNQLFYWLRSSLYHAPSGRSSPLMLTTKVGTGLEFHERLVVGVHHSSRVSTEHRDHQFNFSLAGRSSGSALENIQYPHEDFTTSYGTAPMQQVRIHSVPSHLRSEG